MFSRVALLLAIFGVLSMHNMIFPVKGQCTVKGCESEDSSISIATEIRQMFAEVHERLQVIDRRSQEQLQGMKNLNASFQQMTNQHTTVLIRLEEVKELLLDHDVSTKNESQNLWKLAIGDPLRQKTVTGLEGDRAPPPCLNNWTVIMNRFNGSLNFNRSWTEYKNGFGDIGRGEFWLGNEIVHRLTTRSGLVYALRIEVQLETTGGWYHADYATFSLDSENNNYTLRFSGYNGSAGDSLRPTSIGWGSHCNLVGMSFTTWDADHDRASFNCASYHGGGWWVNECCLVGCLTCPYRPGHFRWYSLKHVASGASLRAARMMIRSN